MGNLENSQVVFVDEDKSKMALIFVELFDFEELKQSFICQYEVLKWQVISLNNLTKIIYTGMVDGSLAYQLQEIQRFNVFPDIFEGKSIIKQEIVKRDRRFFLVKNNTRRTSS